MDTLQIDLRGVDASCAIAESNGLEPGKVFQNYLNKVAKPLVQTDVKAPASATKIAGKPARKVRAS